MAKIEIEIPDELLNEIGKTEEERRAFVLEAVAIDCFQIKQWSTSACGKLMGVPRVEFVRIQSERGVPSPLTGRDIVDDYQIIEKLFSK